MNKILLGDCLEQLRLLPDNSVDSVVTDPPSGIGFMSGGNKDHWDSDKGGRKQWIEWLCGVFIEVRRVLKPGGHCLVWALPRTSHWTGTALEDAGFEVREIVHHIFSTGFPKSHNIGKSVEKLQRGNKTVELINALLEEGKTLKELGEMAGIPSLESSYRDWATGGHKPEERSWERMLKGLGFSEADGLNIIEKRIVSLSGGNTYTFREGKKRDWEMKITKGTSQFEGWGTALKPSVECWWLVRKPLSENTVVENVLKWGTGGINIDECRVGYQSESDKKEGQSSRPDSTSKGMQYYAQGEDNNFNRADRSNLQGRFPANLIHDGSDEVVAQFPQTNPSKAAARGGTNPNPMDWGNGRTDGDIVKGHDDNGSSASRFFYCAKPSQAERNKGCEELEEKEVKGNGKGSLSVHGQTGKPNSPIYSKNIHPTIKSLSLMRYLIKLITPPNGTVLDMFAGSGTTLCAAKQLGMNYIGIEQNIEYIKIAEARILAWDVLEPTEAPEPFPDCIQTLQNNNTKPKLIQQNLF